MHLNSVTRQRDQVSASALRSTKPLPHLAAAGCVPTGLLLCLAAPALAHPALAQGASASPPPAEASAVPQEPSLLYPEEFRTWWKNWGTIYKDPESSPIQELKFFGRMHYQYSSTEGRAREGRFDYASDELRRFRTGVGSKFLDIFDLYAEAEIGDDGRPRGGDFAVNFQHMWQLKLHVDAKKAFDMHNVDGFKIGLGSREINMSYEWVTSSKRIKSIERSPIANKIWAFNSDFANPTGLWANVTQGDVEWTLGAFSTTQDQYWASFDDGELYYGNLLWNYADGPGGEDTDIRFAAFYQDRDAEDEVLAAGLDWAAALSLQHKTGNWEFHTEGIAGNNGDQSSAEREGGFWGAVVMPSYWIEKDSLEGVIKVQYQGAEQSEGIRLNSRYVRRAGGRDGIPSLSNGRGDEHYSIYGGFNKLLSGHQHKIMFGVEYDTIDSEGQDVFDGWSVQFAYRTYW